MRATRRASSRNIRLNIGSLAKCGCSRLIATTRAKSLAPMIRPRWIRGHPAARDLGEELEAPYTPSRSQLIFLPQRCSWRHFTIPRHFARAHSELGPGAPAAGAPSVRRGPLGPPSLSCEPSAGLTIAKLLHAGKLGFELPVQLPWQVLAPHVTCAPKHTWLSPLQSMLQVPGAAVHLDVAASLSPWQLASHAKVAGNSR